MPPEDVVKALVVPNGARIISTTDEDAGIDQYDRSIYLEVDTTSAELAQVLQGRAEAGPLVVPRGVLRSRTQAAEQGSSSPTGPGPTATSGRSGVVVTPVNPSISPALAGAGQTSPTMGLRLRLFQVPDGGS